MALTLALAACGKKSVSDGKDPTPAADKTHEELTFEQSSDLKAAFDTGNLDLFKEVFRKNPGLDLNTTMNDGETLLTSAIKNDYREIRNFLIEKGAATDRLNTNKESPLIAATVAGYLESVKILIDHDVDIDKKDATGMTALHHAIFNSDSEKIPLRQRKISQDIAIFLVKSGASVELTNSENQTPYLMALEHNNVAIQNLIKSIMDREYGTPKIETFISVLQSGDTEKLDFNLSRYPNMPITYESINPLSLAMDYSGEVTALKMMQLLITYKVNVDGPKDAETTPLIKAVKLQNQSFVGTLINAKADINLKDRDGKSALYFAITLKNPRITDVLIRMNADKYYKVRSSVKYDFDACRVLRDTEREADESEMTSINEMKSSLGCRGFRRLSI